MKIEIHHFHHHPQLETIINRLEAIVAALDDLTAQVAQNTNVEASAVTLIQGLAAQIAAAAGSNDSAALATLTSQLNASATALAAAITANTPAAPAQPSS